MNKRSILRPLTWALPLLVAVCATGAFVGAADANEFPSELQGQSLASAVEASFALPGFLIVEQPVDAVGGPISGATVQGGNGSKSFASFPYPGDPVTGYGSLVAAVTGSSPPVGYPAYVAAEYPARPKDELRPAGGPGYALEATAAAGAAASQAALGGAGAAKEPTIQTRAAIGSTEDGIVRATAAVMLRGLSLGSGALTVSMDSEAVTEYVPAKKQMLSRSLVGGELLTSSGVSVKVAPDGVYVNGQKADDSGDAAAKALNSALAPSGLSVSLFPTGADTSGGKDAQSDQGSSAVSGGFVEIRQVLDGSTIGVPKGILTIRLGMVSTALYDPLATTATSAGNQQGLTRSEATRRPLPGHRRAASGESLHWVAPDLAQVGAGEVATTVGALAYRRHGSLG